MYIFKAPQGTALGSRTGLVIPDDELERLFVEYLDVVFGRDTADAVGGLIASQHSDNPVQRVREAVR